MALLLSVSLAVVVATFAVATAAAAPAHPGGRYGTADDMERALTRDPNMLIAICHGFGTPRRRMPGLEQFEEYKHFKCWVVVNSPYQQLCLTVHTLRTRKIFISRAVRAQEAESGDCG
jgi:hypothetical protein